MPTDNPMDMITVYASEQTNSRRPGVRLVCACGWGVVAVHHRQARSLADTIAIAEAHVREAHRDVSRETSAPRKPGAWARLHPTCVDISGMDQAPGTEYVCGPGCPVDTGDLDNKIMGTGE